MTLEVDDRVNDDDDVSIGDSDDDVNAGDGDDKVDVVNDENNVNVNVGDEWWMMMLLRWYQIYGNDGQHLYLS